MYIHVGGNHWICTAALCEDAHIVKLYDSLCAGLMPDETVLQICNIYSHFLPPDVDTIDIHRPALFQQKGLGDCGLYALAYATELCIANTTNCHIENIRFSQDHMQQHLEVCIRKGEMTAFPRDPEIKLYQDDSTLDVFSINLFCICKMPDIYDELMVECTNCSKWFHFKCVGLMEGDCIDDWLCDNCY